MLAVTLLFVALGPLGFWKALRARLPRRQRVVTWTLAALVGATTLLLPAYPIDARTRAVGFPLPAAFFQQDDHGNWLDYVGPLTVPFFYANAVLNAGVILLTEVLFLKRWNAAAPPRERKSG
jgi:hypothetical protein